MSTFVHLHMHSYYSFLDGVPSPCALTLHALETFYEQGTTHVLTDTDGDSLTKAYRIYQKAGMHIFRREYVYEKMIRLDRDLVIKET